MKAHLGSFIIALTAIVMSNASACTSVSVDAQQIFFVSGVMKKNGEDTTIKLMHSVVRERSENDALQAFVRSAVAQYPDYKMASVLATKEASVACQKSSGLISV